MRTSPHAENEAFYAPQASGRLATPSDDTRDIIRVAIHALDRVWKDGFRYMKAGIMLGDFFSQGVAQLNLFDEYQPQANSAALMQVVDRLNRSGRGSVWFAGQGIQKSWAMKA
ncbi:DNA polymerase V subunit UmuC [Raoultella terrigena]|uniref:DNA polymerase V subunit UmuC n=1 Tax=Raoultella terrigena TaxID=577 RepID=A0A4U9CRR2_RAOTE|nr:DNA polymerase V subunit UmuC [Raoultella terrigena]